MLRLRSAQALANSPISKFKYMLRFFRRIRQSLLESNRFRKYLIYAIGEIALVMIGILLALQVNNWNNERINNQLESKILRQLHQDFLENQRNFEHVTSFRRRNMNDLRKVIDLFPIDIEKVNLDSLSYYIKKNGYRGTFNPANGAINTITNSSSFEIIRDEKLRNLLVQWKDQVEDYLEDDSLLLLSLIHISEPTRPY